MNLHLVLPVAALAVLAALPASAQSYDPQGGGGAGPYDLRCQQIRNFNQREACTARLQRRYRAAAPRAHIRVIPTRRTGMTEQGGGGAGPFVPRCRQFSNFNQREACTARVQAGMTYSPAEYSPGPFFLFGAMVHGGDEESIQKVQSHRG
jgi:hypothetical protein